MKSKFQTLQPWLFQILQCIKREVKHEHLAKSPIFYRKHFGNRPQNRLTNEEICMVYEKELLHGEDDGLREWVVNRWVFQNGQMYQYFADHLSRIHADFDEIKSLDEVQAETILKGAVEAFGPLNSYIFSVLNGVVFQESVFTKLREMVQTAEVLAREEAQEQELVEGLEQIRLKHAQEIARLEKKCEEKVQGVVKKWTNDVEALKKQIRALQQKVNGKC